MARWFWYFVLYSFIGFLLEVVFARVIRNPKRDRKCLYFLPLCPVYGLGAAAILCLPDGIRTQPLLLFLGAAVVATLVEFFTGLFYEKVAHVSFWDYSHLPLNIKGRVCLLFTGFWGLLGLGLVYGVHPGIESLVSRIPASWMLPMLLFLALDFTITIFVLRRSGRTESLRWYQHLGQRVQRHE